VDNCTRSQCIYKTRRCAMTLPRASLIFVLISILWSASTVLAQTESATVSGRVTDTDGATVAGTEVQLESVERGITRKVSTNDAGIYVFTSVQPGQYHMTVTKPGFRQVELAGLALNVQDHVEKNFRLHVGSTSESITVSGDASLVNTEDAAVSTVVDRNFAENLPMNGRSFQTLIELTPGTVLTPSNKFDSGQFSVNGQRTTSNYWTVDGVSANIGISASNTGVPGNGLAGALGAFSSQGGTNSLVSVDAMQEFRIQTSTYAPEFGRTPGAQISIVTRPGTNQFHGSAFDYLRNDLLDANNWFNAYTNNPPLPKAKERQNDFGGTVSGPLFRNRAFFFFSYEGLRLRLPQTALTTVPSLASRQTASAAMQPYLNAYPVPNGSALANGIAAFSASYSDSSNLDAYSLRIDHQFDDRITLFVRLNYSPSETQSRGNGNALSVVSPYRIAAQTETLGATATLAPRLMNDFRLNLSRVNSRSSFGLDNFGGAVPLSAAPFPAPFTTQDSLFNFNISPLTQGVLQFGRNAQNVQRQMNVVDTLSQQIGAHSLKFGFDFRRLNPFYGLQTYLQQVLFLSVPSAQSGSVFVRGVSAGNPAPLLFRNLGAYAQDTWRVHPRFTLTYGLRWDVDFAPSSTPTLQAVTNFDNPSQLALAPDGTPAFETPYRNFAPRVGGAYQVTSSQSWSTIFRGGFGVFYDLATSETGNGLFFTYPFGFQQVNFFGTFPLSPSAAAPPAIVRPGGGVGTVVAFDPHLKLPYTYQWNVALEQALGTQQVLSVSYIGSAGRRLIQSAFLTPPNSNFRQADLIGNSATSDYDALQLQFRRRLSHGLQTLASYTWSHSIDTASAGSYAGSNANAYNAKLNANGDRGPSDFDVRHAFSAGVTYAIPVANWDSYSKAFLGGWSLHTIIQARSASPVNIADPRFGTILQTLTQIRPDVVPGQPFYLYGAQYPGGKAFNPAAFVDPPSDPVTKLPVRQGTLSRNALRGFGAAQWDFALHRDFPVRESLKLEFRAEMFNILNHPNFGSPNNSLTGTFFGKSTQMLAGSLNSPGGAGLSQLYQIGGPRSIQFALKLGF
jgi:hypothetical protein